jgi:hypothetical protein
MPTASLLVLNTYLRPIGQCPGGASTSSHVAFASIVVISSSMALRQHSCACASWNDVGSSLPTTSRFASHSYCASPSAGPASMMFYSVQNWSGPASSWSASSCAFAPAGGDTCVTTGPGEACSPTGETERGEAAPTPGIGDAACSLWRVITTSGWSATTYSTMNSLSILSQSQLYFPSSSNTTLRVMWTHLVVRSYTR